MRRRIKLGGALLLAAVNRQGGVGYNGDLALECAVEKRRYQEKRAMNRRMRVLTCLLLVAVMVALVGPRAAQAQEETSQLRFLHAVPGLPDVDVYLDGALVAPGVSYAEATPHLTVTAGAHQVTLRQAGSGAEGAALAEVSANVLPALAFALVVQGTAETVDAFLYEDILDEIAPGMARLTAINAIADSPAAGLDVLNASGGPLLQGVGYGVQYGTININSGMQDLAIVPAGGSLDGAITSVGQVDLQSSVLYTLVALGTLDGDVEPTSLVLATPVKGAADSVRVRIAHGSPDAPAVDVYANDVLLVPSLGLGEMSEHIALPAGDYTLGLRAAGSPPADEPVVSSDITLDAGTPAVTVVALGELSDGSLALQSFPDNVADITAENARIAVINAVPGATASVTVNDPDGTALATDLAVGTQAEAVDVPAGEYLLSVNVAGIEAPVDVAVPAQVFTGGTYYSVLVYGGGVTETPIDARTAATNIAVAVGSLPGASAEVVAAVPTPEAVEATPEGEVVEPTAEGEVVETTPEGEVVEATPEGEVVEATPVPEVVEATPEGEVVEATPVPEVVQPTPTTGTGETELVPAQETPASEVVQATQPPAATPVPIIPIAQVELNEGANLQCREYPRPDARSLGLIPAGTTLNVIGRMGLPIVPDTGNPTPEPTPVIESVEDLWLSIEWAAAAGGFIRCWVAAQYLRVEFNGRVLDDLEELFELPEEPFNRPGEAVNVSISPPTPRYNAILATVNIDPGRNLQLRRYPNTSAEALALVPAGAQLEVLGYVEQPSEGLVGQPVDPYWIRGRYIQENGGATIGWVSAQYVTISQADRALEITELPLADPEEAGFQEAPGQAPVIPVEQQDIVGVVNLNPGANLNLRDRPSQDALVVRAIPSGEVVTVLGRNGDGTWVRVTYQADGLLEGWVATQYLLISQGGQPVVLADLPILSDETDLMQPGQTAPSTATPTPTVEGGLLPTPIPTIAPTITPTPTA